jgi:hypothetical protein
MDGSPYSLSMRKKLSLRKRKKSRGQGFLAWKALLDWNEFNMSKSRAEGIS